MLFNEPKLLKYTRSWFALSGSERGFSALQRAEIAEIKRRRSPVFTSPSFSALQRAEIAEMRAASMQSPQYSIGFSALQRAEIAEIRQS